MLRTAGLLLTILLSFFAANPAGAAEPTPSVPSPAKMEMHVHELVNKHRRNKGLPLLAFDHRLAAIARRHSEDMAAKRIPLGHDGFKARKAAVSKKIRFQAIAENVGMNNYPAAGTVRATVSGWLDSERHRENIEGDYNLTGVGIAQDHRGTRYFTQLFVRRK